MSDNTAALTIMFFVFGFIVWLISPVIAGVIAKRQGRSSIGWAVLTLLFPLLVVLSRKILLVGPDMGYGKLMSHWPYTSTFPWIWLILRPFFGLPSPTKVMTKTQTAWEPPRYIWTIPVLVVLTLIGGYIVADHRYGPAKFLRGPFTELTDSNLGTLRSALKIYYDDNHSYPSDLNVPSVMSFFKGNHLPKIVIETVDGIPHWYSTSDQLAIFKSRNDANDQGGWGYVSDPRSPEYGTVFVNCTHLDNGRRRIPWNTH